MILFHYPYLLYFREFQNYYLFHKSYQKNSNLWNYTEFIFYFKYILVLLILSLYFIQYWFDVKKGVQLTNLLNSCRCSMQVTDIYICDTFNFNYCKRNLILIKVFQPTYIIKNILIATRIIYFTVTNMASWINCCQKHFAYYIINI